MNQILFTARVTDDVPPKLSVGFGKDSPFTRRNAPCEEITVGGDKQCKINLGTKTVDVEAINTLASGGDYGKSLTLRQVSQNSYACDDEDEVSTTLGNVAQVVLQIRNASLVAEFSKGGAGPVAPMMPGATATPANSNPWGDWGASPASTTTPAKPNLTGWGDWGKGAPVAVVAAAPQPPVTPLRGDLPQEIWSNKRLVGTLYSSYQWYVRNPNRPSGGKDQSDYDSLYPIFVKEERLYATLQEKLRAAAAHDKLSFCLSASEVPGPLGLFYKAMQDAQSQPNTSWANCMSSTDQQHCLQAERNHLAQQARNEYNAAN